MANKKNLFSWSKYATGEFITGVIANGAKQNIVLTFKGIKPFHGCVYTDFAVTGTAKTIDSVTLDYAANTVTIHVTVAYASGNTCNVVYTPTVAKGTAITIPVTNNVL